jgi:hypothetical protein
MVSCVLGGASLASLALSQTSYDEGLLAVKRRFAENEIAALAEPFRGVATASGIEPGLFSIRATGVSTDPIREDATSFLSTLTEEQQIRTVFSVDAPEWRRWCNVDNGIYVRQGVSLEEMTADQKDAAWGLLGSSLSPKGLTLSRNIMKTDQTLLELNEETLSYGEEKYFFTMMGLPSAVEPWGWQLDGHHLAINYFVLGDQVVMSPVFLGGEPVVTESGKYAGNAILQHEQDQGLAFLRSLTDDQRHEAILDPDKTTNNMLAAASSDNVTLDYAGLRVATLTDSQKQQLLRLVGLFVANLREGHARVRMDEIGQHLDKTTFAWIGGTSDDAVFYYRIHSPVVLIEFDHKRPVGTAHLRRKGVPTRQHIHVVVRTPNGNDYGKDLLRQHLEAHQH